MSRQKPVRTAVLALALLTALLAGCSRDGDTPLSSPITFDTPGELPAGGPLGERSELTFAEAMAASESATYASISIAQPDGATLLGTCPGYSDTCKLEVPSGAYQGLLPLTIMVPCTEAPVYQLLPHGQTFNTAVTVTLDYSLWLTNGTLAVGDTLELFYMDEVNEEFVRLSPPAIAVADSAGPTITFQTLHFSRWLAGKKRD
jgi:hypothetical protein